jgi:hypothetical protein
LQHFFKPMSRRDPALSGNYKSAWCDALPERDEEMRLAVSARIPLLKIWESITFMILGRFDPESS